MNFTKLIPSVFYKDISDGLYLFVECLQFKIQHKELNTSHPYCVLNKDGISIMLFQDEQLAKEHNPELRLATDNIEEVFAKVSVSHPHLLHPNLNKVTLRPWGAKEFAIADNQLGIRFQQRIMIMDIDKECSNIHLGIFGRFRKKSNIIRFIFETQQ